LNEESQVKYMELSPMIDDLERGSSLGLDGDQHMSCLDAEPPLQGSLVDTLVSIEAVLGDTSERTHFRDFCDKEGLLSHFKFFQAVEDLHRCSNDASVRSHISEIQTTFITPGSSLHIALHPDTLYEIQNLIDFGNDPKACFDNAQREVIATLKLLVYRTYMRERHAMVCETTENPPPIDEASVLTDSPLYKTVLRMLNSTTERIKLMAIAEEVDAVNWLEFISCVQGYKILEPEEMPAEAHNIVEKFMTLDSGLRLHFSEQIQQELINTETPHHGLFDRALREAFHTFVHLLCLESPVSSTI